MAEAVTDRLPRGWRRGEWDERWTALRVLPRRVRVLLAAAWARSVLSAFESRFPGDSRPRRAIEAAEAWAIFSSAGARAVAADAARAAYADAYAAEDADAARAADANLWPWLYATYAHARGPVGLVFDPAWRSDTAVSLARGIVTDRAFDRMPILADALQDAGCENAEVLRHLQHDCDEWTAAAWPVWNLLDMGAA